MTPSEPSYRTIKLSKGQVAIIDEEDYPDISKHKWYAVWSKKTQSFYACRTAYDPDTNKKLNVYMHRQLLGLHAGDKREGDHIRTGETLDNRRSNLRIATHQENNWNARIRRDNTSGFKGVVFSGKGWRFSLCIKGRKIQSKEFPTPEEAHRQRCILAVQHHGEFART